MAKKAKETGEAAILFPGSKRRHLHLILPKLLSEKAFAFHFDADRLTTGQSELKRWADLARQGALRQKETSLDAQFLDVIFAKALGYKWRSDSPESYHIERQYPVPGAGTCDGALGAFSASPGAAPANPAVVIECKGADTDLDHDKFNGRTPVQQLWDYLSELPGTPWGVLTNYLEIRLYHRDSPRRAYQSFHVSEFVDPERVREFLYLLAPEGLLGNGRLQRPRGAELITTTQDRRIEVGDRLYDYYSDQRFNLIGTLIDQYKYSTNDAIHAAQRLLDRVIFIAFCQYRGLLPAKLLENTWKNIHPLALASNPRWQAFLTTFRAIDKGHRALDLPTGYNGGLFRKDPLVDDLDLEDEPWTDVFKGIGDYDFRDEGEINVEVLGHLFERSITELEKYRVIGLFGKQGGPDGAPQMPKSALRKRFGIYYTPPQFTRFIVERTLGRLIEERVEVHDDVPARLAALRGLKVVDPACGSGAFLIAAYERLEDAYEVALHRLRVEGKTDEAAQIEREYPDWILSDNLFGVDMSAESVEISQLALWIRSARKGKTLADLSRNIVCGNSLVADPAVHERAMDWRQTFPAVFAAGGFDCVIGNPPWERVKQQKREFFAFVPEVLLEANPAKARAMIDSFETARPDLFARWQAALESAATTSEYARRSERYPLTARGDVNYAMLFAELSRFLVAPAGLIGLLIPSGIATDDTTKHFFNDLTEKKALAGLYDFENKDGVFADVHRAFKFSVLLMTGSSRATDEADFVFFARRLEDLEPKDRHIRLSARDLKLLNPNTHTCPIFRTRRDCELTKRIYRNVPILVDKARKAGGNAWGIRFWTMFHQSGDAGSFRDAAAWKKDGFSLDGVTFSKGAERALPLYEAKMVQAFDHRAASVFTESANWARHGQTDETSLVEHQNPEFSAVPRWWVSESEVIKTCGGSRRWGFIGFKDVTSATNQRTMIAGAIPWSAVTHHFPLIDVSVPVRRHLCLLANLNALAYDYVARQKLGGTTFGFYHLEQLPTLPPERYEEKCPWDGKGTLEKWVSERVLKLTCTADDLRPLAEAAGFREGVHRWNDAERAKLRAELDAAYFLLYGLSRDEVDYVLDQFQGVVKEDESHGRPGPTRQAILEAYEAMRG